MDGLEDALKLRERLESGVEGDFCDGFRAGEKQFPCAVGADPADVFRHGETGGFVEESGEVTGAGSALFGKFGEAEVCGDRVLADVAAGGGNGRREFVIRGGEAFGLVRGDLSGRGSDHAENCLHEIL